MKTKFYFIITSVFFLLLSQATWAQLKEVKGVETRISGSDIEFTNRNSFSITVVATIWINTMDRDSRQNTYKVATKSFVLKPQETYTWSSPLRNDYAEWNKVLTTDNYPGKYYTYEAYRLE